MSRFLHRLRHGQLRPFDPFPEFSEVRAFRGRRETGGRQFYKSGGLIVPRYEMLPGVLVQGGAAFGQREVNGAWRGARDGEPLIGDGGLRGAEARANSIRNPVMAGAVAGTPGVQPTHTNFGSLAGVTRQIIGNAVIAGIPGVVVRYFGTPASSANIFINLEAASALPASNGQVWTLQVFSQVLSGALPNNAIDFLVSNRDAGGFVISGAAAVAGNNTTLSSLRELRVQHTITNPSTSLILPYAQIPVTAGVEFDVTFFIGGANLKQGPDINDPPILQTSGLAATRTVMAYRETGRNIAPVHYGVARARWLAPIANQAASFSHLMEFRASDGPARVLWYASLAGNATRFTAGSTGGVGDPVIAWGTPTVGQWATVAWALRGAELAVSQNGGAISSAAMSALTTLTQVSFLNGATGLSNVANAELDFSATVNGEITNDNLQALSARFAA